MDTQTAVVIIGVIAAGVPGVIGFLTKRSIDALDKSIEHLSGKIEHLTNRDTATQVAIGEFKRDIAELTRRVTELERSR